MSYSGIACEPIGCKSDEQSFKFTGVENLGNDLLVRIKLVTHAL